MTAVCECCEAEGPARIYLTDTDHAVVLCAECADMLRDEVT